MVQIHQALRRSLRLSLVIHPQASLSLRWKPFGGGGLEGKVAPSKCKERKWGTSSLGAAIMLCNPTWEEEERWVWAMKEEQSGRMDR